MTMPDRPRVLVLTNMWPDAENPTRGGFVAEQVEDVRAVLPDWRFDVMEIDGRKGRAQYLRAIFTLRHRLRGGYDLVHAHYGLSGLVGAFQRRAPLVVTYHGSDVYIPWQARLSRWAARSAAATIFVSERLRAKLGTGDGSAVTAVVPCGVDLEQFTPGSQAEARRQIGLSEDAIVVLFPGDPTRDVKGYPLFRATLAALPAELGDRVVPLVLTGLPHAEVPTRLRAADAVLLTSVYEGAGTVAKEAVACGVPVVSTDVGDVATVVEGLPGCAVAERDPAALADALARAVRTPRGWEGRNRLEALGMDRPAVARRVADVYRAVLDGSGDAEDR